MRNLKFKRYGVGDSFDPTNAEKDTLHFVPISTDPLTVEVYDVDEHGNVAKVSFDGWAENKEFIINNIESFQEQVTEKVQGSEDVIKKIDNIVPRFYTDENEVSDLMKFIDINTGVDANFKEVSKWTDNTDMDDSKADGYIYVKKDNKFYKRQFEGSINVKWFGAKGDGNIDDTSAIQKAFDYVFSQKANNQILPTIHIPVGQYKISDTLQFPSSGSLTGEGVGASVLKMADPNKDLLHIKSTKNETNTQDERREYTTIRNIIFLGANSHIPAAYYKENSAPNSSGIVVDKVIKVNIENCEINGFNNYGLVYKETYYNKLQNTISRNNRFGILIENNATSLQAVGCEFRQNTCGVLIKNSWANSFVNCLIETNFNAYSPPPGPNQVGYDVMTHSGTGVHMYNSRANYFTNCYFEANTMTFNFFASKNNVVQSCFISVGLTQTGMPTFLNPFMAAFLSESMANVFQNNFYETYPLEFKELLIYSNSIDNYFVGSREEMYKFLEQNQPYIQANIDISHPERNVRFYAMSEHLFLDNDSVIKTM